MRALSSAKRQNQQRWRWGDGGDRGGGGGDKDSPSTRRHKRNKYQSELAAVEWRAATVEREVQSKNFFSCLLGKRFLGAVAGAFQWARRPLRRRFSGPKKERRAFHSICLFDCGFHSISPLNAVRKKESNERNVGGSCLVRKFAEEVQVFGGGGEGHKQTSRPK